MESKSKLELWSFLGVVGVIFLFIFFSYLIQSEMDFFDNLIVAGWTGMFLYVLFHIISVVFAPIASLPLFALAVGLWGVWTTVILSVIGWTIGATIAFWIARKFGVPVVERFFSLEKIYKFEEKTRVGSSFWSVLFLRMIVPVEVLSYALGLFSKIKFWKYFLATFIGVIPFAFVFAYFGGVSYVYQIIFGTIFLICVLIFLIFKEIRKR